MKKRGYTSFAIIRSYSAVMLFTISVLATAPIILLHQVSDSICGYGVPNGSVVDPSAGTVTFPNGSTVATTELHCQATNVVWQSVGIAAIERYLPFALIALAATVPLVVLARRRSNSDGQNRKKSNLSMRMILIALIVLFVISYAIPVVSVSACPLDSWGCSIGIHGPVHVSLTRYFFHFGAESSSAGYSIT